MKRIIHYGEVRKAVQAALRRRCQLGLLETTAMTNSRRKGPRLLRRQGFSLMRVDQRKGWGLWVDILRRRRQGDLRMGLRMGLDECGRIQRSQEGLLILSKIRGMNLGSLRVPGNRVDDENIPFYLLTSSASIYGGFTVVVRANDSTVTYMASKSY